jgi:hypothetical protein
METSTAAPNKKIVAPRRNTEDEEKEYCPSCCEFVVPDGDRCPNAHCRWCLR